MNDIDFQFDESVQRALEKWPDVPNCFGWISLDRRGQWLIKKEVITHDRAKQFLARNYTCDRNGRWFIQNGPQRVFCDLDIAPLVFCLNPDLSLTSHTLIGCETLIAIILDEHGNLFCDTNIGLGILDDRDLTKFYDAVAENLDDEFNSLDFEFVRKKNQPDARVTISFNGSLVPVLAIPQEELEAKYDFICNPQPIDPEI